MARYHDVPDDIKIQSEMIEPAFGSIIGRLFAQAKYMKQTQGIDSMAYADALENLYQAADAISSLSGLCIDTHHAKIAANNHVMHIRRYIEHEIGCDPALEENQPLRHNTKIHPAIIEADELRFS